MAIWSTSHWRVAAAGGLAALSVIGLAGTASAHTVRPRDRHTLGDGPDAWGTIVPGNKECTQSDAWMVSIKGAFGIVNTKLFESHFPSIPDAPDHRNGGKDLVNLTFPAFGTRVGLGVVSALYTRAIGNELPANPGDGSPSSEDTVASRCSAFAEAGGGAVDVGVPYIAPATTGGTQRSPIGVHVEGISVDATARPGQPVALNGGAARGYFSVGGKKVISIPPLWPTNFGVRIPSDRSLPTLATAITNEQVTTDNQGRPTLDSKGHSFTDPTATSGYVNAVHASALGTNGADVIVGHAAVLTRSSPVPPCSVPEKGTRCTTTP